MQERRHKKRSAFSISTSIVFAWLTVTEIFCTIFFMAHDHVYDSVTEANEYLLHPRVSYNALLALYIVEASVSGAVLLFYCYLKLRKRRLTIDSLRRLWASFDSNHGSEKTTYVCFYNKLHAVARFALFLTASIVLLVMTVSVDHSFRQEKSVPVAMVASCFPMVMAMQLASIASH